MNRPDHTTYREWLNLDADGMLPREERARLDEHLATCPECRRERDELAALDRLFQETRIAVRPDFRESVLAALPAAGWEARSARAWRFPVAALVLLAGIAAALLSAGSIAGADSSGLGTLAAVVEMVWATVMAGSGLLKASWKGIGIVVEDVLSSPLTLGAFGVFVLCLNLLLVSLVRRRRPAELPAAPGGRGGEEGRG
ncbi:MAG TPA: zf-HC2 domain-containing protein [Thermoanaerobaculia bacterium]|nr:zf-HC2 domain-containing protein [Thermoanaerobaculia bacterium]